MLGTIIGAGFFSGRELVGFFGTDYFIIFLVIAGLLMTVSFISVYGVSRRFGGLDEINRKLFHNSRLIKYSILFTSFVCLSGMLAGLDAVWESFNVLPRVPVLSILVLLVLVFTSRFGIKGVSKLNIILVPLILIIILYLVSCGNDLNFFEKTELNFTSGVVGFFKALLYVCMNVFFTVPIIAEMAHKKSKINLIVSSFFTVMILVIFAILILAVISGAGENAKQNHFPFLYAITSNTSILIYKITLFVSILTSALTSYYPLYNHVNTYSKRGNCLLFVSAFLASRCGFDVIIDYVFPLISGIGALFIVRCIVFLIKERKVKYKK